MKSVTDEMAKLQSKSVIKLSQEQNMADILEYTELIFAKNEHQLSQNYKTKQMAGVITRLCRIS